MHSLNEERAIVSEIAGTTRDTIEDEIAIGGFGFRFIDTAGIRETSDVVEGIGIRKTFEKIEQAQVVLYLLEAPTLFQQAPSAIGISPERGELSKLLKKIKEIQNKYPTKKVIIVANKIDKISAENKAQLYESLNSIEDTLPQMMSAKTGEGVDALKSKLLEAVNSGALRNNETIVTNTRHYDALLKAYEEVDKVQTGLSDGLSGDLLAIDIRQALFHFGEITGEITSDDLLGNIFANFCIGK